MNVRRFFLHLFFIFFLIATITGCAVLGAREQSCGFGFAMPYDGQHASIFDYQLYGEKAWIIGAQKGYVAEGTKFHGEGIGFQYDRPHSLYVKWQDDLTGSVYEDTVNLRQILPRDLDHTYLYFIVHGSQLYVYLAFLNKVGISESKVGSVVYKDYENIQLYPTPSKT